MRITDIEVAIVSIPLNHPISISTKNIEKRKYATVEVRTDADISGIGLTYEAAAILVDKVFRKEVINRDPYEKESIWASLYGSQGTSHGRWGTAVQAIGAIDMALWDIIGKAQKKPLYKLLGGSRKKVPCYASAGYYEKSKGPKKLAEEIIGYIDRGFRAVKIRVGRLSLRKDIERVKAVRDAVGNDICIMVDANNAYNRYEAIKAGREFEKYSIFWFEEPVSPDDVQGSAMLANALDIPIACGELESGRYRFKELMEAKAVDIVQPDVMVCGGISEWIKIANIADAYKIPVAPHSVHDIHVHLAAAYPNTLFVEFFDKNADLTKYSEIYDGYGEPVDGFLEVPNRPGLGIDLKHDVIEKYRVY